MNSQFNTKVLHGLVPTSTATNATATASFDCKGFGNAQILIASTLTNKPTSILVQHGDTTSAYTDLILTSAFTYTDASAGQILAAISIPLNGKKRYLKVSVTPSGSTATLDMIALLGEGSVGISSAATKNAGTFYEIA